MPGGDRTGPRGFGPMTGKGFGSCYGQQPGGWFSPGQGQFGGFGFGRGRAWRHCSYARGLPGWPARLQGGNWWGSPDYRQKDSQEEIFYLREHSARLEEELNALRVRMAELEGTEKAE